MQTILPTSWDTIKAILFALAIIFLFTIPVKSKTLLQMDTGVRYLIEEPSAYYFTTAEVTFTLNKSQRAILDRLLPEAIVELTDITTQAVSLSYTQTLPTSQQKILQVMLDTGSGYYKATEKNISEIWSLYPNANGEIPSDTNPFYVVVDNSIRLFPLQDSAGTLEVHFIKFPTELSADGDECELSERVEDLIIIQAAIYLLLKDHESAKATALEERLVKEIDYLNARFGMTK